MDQPISNPFKVQFITTAAAAAAAGRITLDQLDVLDFMADSLKLSDIAFTNWRRINEQLGREPKDKRVVRTLAELRQLGWIRGRKWGFILLAVPAIAAADA